jgi:hypothetical protein
MLTDGFPGGGHLLSKIAAIGHTGLLASTAMLGLTPTLLAVLGRRSVMLDVPRSNAAL